MGLPRERMIKVPGRDYPLEQFYRIAVPDDAFTVSGLLREQYIEHRIDAPMEELVPAVGHLIGSPGSGVIFVALEGSEIVGTAVMTFTWSVEHRGKIAWLDELYVVPKSRGKGIGKNLLDMVVKKASEKRCRAIELEVDHEHKRAERLYRREGFDRVTRNRFVLKRY